VRLQTLPNAAVGAHARSTDPALILLAGVGASFDFDFNDYLHIASLSAVPQPCATARNVQNPDLVHFPLGNFLTSSVIIVSPVSGNRLRAHNNRGHKQNNPSKAPHDPSFGFYVAREISLHCLRGLFLLKVENSTADIGVRRLRFAEKIASKTIPRFFASGISQCEDPASKNMFLTGFAARIGQGCMSCTSFLRVKAVARGAEAS